jgi:hypothetical protein
MPGSAPDVSTSVTIGSPKREASSMSRLALRYPSGETMPEVAPDIFLGVAALLLREHHDAAPANLREPADERLIVAEMTVAVQLVELIEARDVVAPRSAASDGAPCARAPRA